MAKQLWIIGRQKGQLGNRLMFFAHAYAWCLHTGRTLYYPSLGPQADLFPAFAGQMFNSPDDPSPVDWPLEQRLRFQASWIKRRRLLARFGLVTTLNKPGGLAAIGLPPSYDGFPSRRVDRAQRVYSLGWRYQNPLGVQRYRQQILRATTPAQHLLDDAAAFTGSLDPSRLWIGVHVRGRDYRTFLGGKHCLSLEVINDAMARARQRLAPRNVGFVVFSDEPRSQGEFPGFDVRLSGGNTEQDLFRMSTLPGMLGPMSTFTTWAMFRSGGALWQIGPDPAEDGLDWAFNGWPMVRSIDRWAQAVDGALRGEVFVNPPDLRPEAMRTPKRSATF